MRRMRREDYPVFLFLLCFNLYLFTLAPQIFWRDSAEFVATAHQLGISHPAGSPTYNLLAKLVSLLPLGSIVWRIHLFSALCAALACLLLFQTILLLLDHLYPGSKVRGKEPLALLSTTLFALSFAFWRWSVCAEVYSLQELFIIGAIYITLRYRFNQDTGDQRAIFLGAFILCLGLGAHMTNALYIPAFGLFFVLTNRKALSLRVLGLSAFFGLLGFSIYLYLPLRCVAGTPLPLGTPSTLGRFWDHITASRTIKGEGGLLEQNFTPYSLRNLPSQLERYLGNLTTELSLLGLIMGGVGLFALMRKDPRLCCLTSLIFLANLFFFRNWRASFGFIPSFLIYTIWIGVGVYQICYSSWNYLEQRRDSLLHQGWISASLILAMLLQNLITFGHNLRYNNLSGFYTLYELTDLIASSIDYKSVLITQLSIPQFPLWYYRWVENDRPDLRTIPIVEFPRLRVLERLLKNEEENYNFYWIGCACEVTDRFQARLVPHGLIFKFLSRRTAITIPGWSDHLSLRSRWEERLRGDPYATDYESYVEIYRINNNLFYYYLLKGEVGLAEEEFRRLLRINPDSPVLNMIYGYILAEEREFKRAASYFNRTLELRPRISPHNTIQKEREILLLGIGLIFFKEGKYGEAIQAFTRYLALNPLSFVGHYYLGLSLVADNQPLKALEQFRQAQALRPSDKEVKRYIHKLEGRLVPLPGKGKE